MDCGSLLLRPCIASHTCYDGQSSTAACWIFACAQLAIAAVLLIGFHAMTYFFILIRSRPRDIDSSCSSRKSINKANNNDIHLSTSKEDSVQKEDFVEDRIGTKVKTIHFVRGSPSRTTTEEHDNQTTNIAAVTVAPLTREESPVLIKSNQAKATNTQERHLVGDKDNMVRKSTTTFPKSSLHVRRRSVLMSESSIDSSEKFTELFPGPVDVDLGTSIIDLGASLDTDTNTSRPNMIQFWREMFGNTESLKNPSFHSVSAAANKQKHKNAGEEQDQMVFVSPVLRTKRSEKNFLKHNHDETIEFPSDYDPEYITLEQNAGLKTFHVIRSIMSRKKASDMLRTSLGFAFLTSGISSVLTILFSFGDYLSDYCEAEEYGENHLRRKEWLLGIGLALNQTIAAFKFLPIFLLLAAFGFLVDRWRRFMMVCHKIQGRINDIGIMCGSIPSTPVKESSRKTLYTIYRYLNTIHIINLKSFSPVLHDISADVLYHDPLNLLTEEEVSFILSMESKAQMPLVAMLADVIDDLLEQSDKKDIHASKGPLISSKLCALRGTCADIHDMFMQDNPNEYTVAISILIFVYKVLIVLAYPLEFQTSANSGYAACSQPGVFIGVFISFLAISLPPVLFKVLHNPFSDNGGIVVDNLIANTELTLFQCLRIKWLKCQEPDETGQVSIIERRRMTATLRKTKRFTLRPARGGFGDL